MLVYKKTHSHNVQVLLGAAYQKIEAQLGTVAGLEFIRAWHAIQVCSHGSAVAYTLVPGSRLE